jgi:hypothetical protein
MTPPRYFYYDASEIAVIRCALKLYRTDKYQFYGAQCEEALEKIEKSDRHGHEYVLREDTEGIIANALRYLRSRAAMLYRYSGEEKQED